MELTIIISAVITFFEILGVVSAIDAIMKSRTSQGAIAWVISLVTMPFVVVPLYWVFGRNKFKGYVKLRNSTDVQVQHIIDRSKAIFEITVFFFDAQFAGEIEEMLENDFAKSRKVTLADIEDRFIGFKVLTRLARLMSPVL